MYSCYIELCAHATYVSYEWKINEPHLIQTCTFVTLLHRYISDHSDSAVSPHVTCVDTVTVHLHSQCSGACSDVQETAEVQS